MKQLLYIICIISSLTGFSQDHEKKGICSSGISLFHSNGDDFYESNRVLIDGFNTSHVYEIVNFTIDSTTWTDSLIYELRLPFGDSLTYSASWHADGMCYYLDSADVNSLVTILKGIPFPIAHKGDYDMSYYYNLSQIGYIKDPCLFKIQKRNSPDKYFFRIKFYDPEVSVEGPFPKISEDISVWQSSENMLTVQATEGIAWNIDLYSLSGQLIQNNKLEGSQDLDISTLSKGCYIARISSEKGLKKQLKFIR